MYQSMPGSLRFDGFGALGGPLSRATSQLNPLPEGESCPALMIVLHAQGCIVYIRMHACIRVPHCLMFCFLCVWSLLLKSELCPFWL